MLNTRLRYFVASLISLLLPCAAHASIYATSFLDISDFSVTITAGAANIVPGTPLALHSHNLTAEMDGEGSDSSNSAGLAISNLTGHANVGTAVTAPVYPGPTVGAFPDHGTVAVNYAFASSTGDGNILTPGGADSTTMSSLGTGVSPPAAGMASASDQLQVINITTTGPVTLFYTFTATLDLDFTNMPSTPPFTAFLLSDYTIQINGLTGGDIPYSSLNDTTLEFQGYDDLIQRITTSTDLPAAPQISGKTFTSQSITLSRAGSYQFQITQTAEASLASIPEPTTLVIWGVVSLLGTATMRRGRVA